MSDVNETLQDLMERRLRELGKRRGRGESISLREAYQRLIDWTDNRNSEAVDNGTDEELPPPTYEVFRRIRNGHTNISDSTASALATMLDVTLDEVYAAARIRPRLGRFELPTRADRLDGQQRAVVISVVDAILSAGAPAAARPPLRAVTEEAERPAARTVGRASTGQRRRAEADRAGEPTPDNPEDVEPR